MNYYNNIILLWRKEGNRSWIFVKIHKAWEVENLSDTEQHSSKRAEFPVEWAIFTKVYLQEEYQVILLADFIHS